MMNKSWFSKYALVWMIGSLMLLFTVLLIWNIENYNGQKKELYKLIDYNAQLAAGEVRDSLLKITLNGTINTTIKTTNENQYVSIILSDKRKETSNDSLIFDMVSKFEKSKSSMDSISKLNESEGAFTSGKDRFENKTVTVLHRRLKENNIPFTYTYSSIDSLLIDSDNVNNEQWQKITSQKSEHQLYLLKKILPSLLISILLFISICGTYLLIYKSWKQQQKINEFKSEFVNNMTHELKTPISTVAVALEVLGNYGAINDPQKSKEYIDIAQHEVNRLNMLIDKVLKMSMFENGVIKMSKEEVDLKKIVNAILASMKLHFDKYQVKIDFNCIGEKFTITGDAVHITNVIYNLIDNAIKYSKDNPKINLNLFSKKDTLELTVTDNGIGIPKEDVTKIFAQFYRVPSDNVHDVKGHGLGLNYVQSIIEEHNGKISVESEFGKGSSFIIKLPKTRL